MGKKKEIDLERSEKLRKHSRFYMSEEKICKIAKMKLAGYSREAVGERFSCNKSTVDECVRKYREQKTNENRV